MKRILAGLFRRFDHPYREHSYFVRLKARLLAAIALITLAILPLNVLKVWWLDVPHAGLRVAFNVVIVVASLMSLRFLLRGRLDAAGNTFALLITGSIHATALLATEWLGVEQPLALGIQVFAMDAVVLLFAFAFATRWAALLVTGLVLVGHVALYVLGQQHGPLIGTLDDAAAALLREGSITLLLLCGVVFTIRIMIEAAHRRDEVALRRTQAMNDDLERQVAKRTRELEAAMHETAAALRVKGDFLANMSHEIRTPLNGIVATADLMRRRTDLSDPLAEEVRLISDSGELLLKLIDDILDFSKIEAGQLVLEEHVFELAPLVADCVGLVATRAASGGVGLRWDLATGLPRYCAGDSFRLRQVLLNLLSNAVKFTRSGGQVTLRARFADGTNANAAATARHVSVCFEVIDTGIGMDAATLGRLFERFTQADSSTTRLFGGTGLGLAISSRLVELMGGRIIAESELGQGSRFWFQLSLRADPTTGRPASLHGSSSLAPLDLHVLVAEDNAVNLKIITAQLKALGCRYSVATDGVEAIEALQRGPLPDIVLLDCHMPRLDGWEVSRRLRAWRDDPLELRRAAARLPVVALTAAALAEERQRCLEAGMNDFLAKPAKLDDLEKVLRANTVTVAPFAGTSVLPSPAN